MPFSVSISESRANDYSQKEKDFGFMTYSNSCHAFHWAASREERINPRLLRLQNNRFPVYSFKMTLSIWRPKPLQLTSHAIFVFLLLAVSALPTHTNNATLIPIEENSGKMNYITIEWMNTTSLPSKLEGFSAAVVKHDSETPPRVKHWTISDCESFSREQMAAVIRYYPYVEVVCEKQNSLLYPSVLDDSPTGPKQPDATDWYLTKLTSYRFKEFKIEVEAEETFLKMPLAQCVAFSHEEAPATTEVRLTIAGSPKVTPGISGECLFRISESVLVSQLALVLPLQSTWITPATEKRRLLGRSFL